MADIMNKDSRARFKNFGQSLQAHRLSSSGDQTFWDRTAFRPILEQFHQPLYRYFAAHAAGNLFRAQELTVETLSLIRHRSVPPNAVLTAWLFGLAWDVWNAHSHETARETDSSPISQTFTALRSLPFYPREMLYLRFFAGLETKAIAALMDRSEANTRSLIYQGVLKYRSQMHGSALVTLSVKEPMHLARTYHIYLDAILQGASTPLVVSETAAQATEQLIALRDALTMKPKVRAEIFSRIDQIVDAGKKSTTPL
jgi:DNA-directed RNA polymerase specialized sigma24 family protein